MNRCPITYELCGNNKYSEKGLKLLSPKLKFLNDLPYSSEEQRIESAKRAAKMSIQGVQAKLSAILNVSKSIFEITDINGRYIIKPQSQLYRQMPENEDLSMRLAAVTGLEVPLHGMIYSKDGSFSYFIKRFDRIAGGRKLAVEDFAQLLGENRNTKYKSSMEKVASAVESFCTFPLLEKAKLFKMTLFNFLIGNEDMHLKNFSLITINNITKLTPCYDYINSFIAVPGAEEEIALPIKGKKKKLNKNILISYFGKERLLLNDKVINTILNDLAEAKQKYFDLISISFLSKEMKDMYIKTLLNNYKVLFNS